MKDVNNAIMNLFKAYLVEKKKKKFTPNKEALRYGLLMDEKCDKSTLTSAKSNWGVNGYLLNQTFHKSIKTVVKKDLEELLMEQLLHYFTTYGFESLGIFNESSVYIPRELLEVPILDENMTLTYIAPITKKELKEKLWLLASSAIPLSNQTLSYILDLSNYLEIDENNINEVSNRELKIMLYDKLNIIPENNLEFIRYLLYKLTYQTLLIKDKQTLLNISQSDKIIASKLFQAYEKKYGLVPLAEIFNRFKPIFLSLKTREDYLIDDEFDFYGKNDEENKKNELNRIINKISKLSKKYHKPLKTKGLDNFIDWYEENHKKDNYIELLKQLLKNESIWRIIKLRNYLSFTNTKIAESVYKIRNGKTWITYHHRSLKIDKETLTILDQMIIQKLKPNVDGKKVYLDPNVQLVLPQSEKQFVGNIPFSSIVELKKSDLLVGIHWYNTKTERVDLDLKVISNDYTVGWDANYKVGDMVVFTGDVTDAPYPNGASEYIYISKDVNNTMFSLKVNNYTRDVDNIKYELIIAKKPKKKLSKNHVVDPNDILVRIPNIPIDGGKTEHSLGNIVVKDNHIKLIFTDLSTSERRSSFNNGIEELLRNYLYEESKVKLQLKDYLKLSGAILTKNREEADIDLSVEALNKNSIIQLLKD